jgi:hypothetical protein
VHQLGGKERGSISVDHSAVFLRPALAPAQGHALGAIGTLCRLNQHTHFVLAFVARGSLARDLLPASLLFLLIENSRSARAEELPQTSELVTIIGVFQTTML